MTRAATILVLILTATVAGLGLFSWSLSTRLDERGSARVAAPRGEVREESFENERMQRLERELSRLQSELDRVRRERPAEAAPAAPGTEGSAAPPPPPPGEFLAPRRGSDGEWEVPQETEDYFLFLQQRAQRRQRIDAATLASMRRLDRMAQNGEIAAIAGETRRQVEAVVRRHAALSDEVVQRYFRDAEEEGTAVTGEARRDAIRKEREALVASAQRELEPILGGVDAKKIAESALSGGIGRFRGGTGVGRAGGGRGDNASPDGR
jgi:hypothetical protein